MPADPSAADSPFLRAHAQDPIHWQRWGEPALAAAKDSARPLLVHVGYAGCQGSEAMARESFRDGQVAALMDASFVCVLVDRDEMPELDRLLQLAYRLLTREEGSWPLTMFLTHDEGLPFFGGGYYPPRPAAGQPAFHSVLARVAEYHAAQQPALRQQGLALRETLTRIDSGRAGPLPVDAVAALTGARRALESGFDRRNGGWGQAPKFPQVLAIRHLLRHWQASALGEQPDLQALFMASFTLSRIADGGLRDAGAGGFYRYCHDADWQRPQPEKALVDNAQLLDVFAETAYLTGDSAFRAVANETADALLRDLLRTPGPIVANAATVTALAAAARWLGRDELRVAAMQTFDSLRDEDANTLESRSLMLGALLQLRLLGDDFGDMRRACRLADGICRDFEDRERGGFLATAARGLPLFHRLREFTDSGMPSGNALAAGALLRLGRLLDEPRYLKSAERTLRAAATRLIEQPLAHLGLLAVLAESDAQGATHIG